MTNLSIRAATEADFDAGIWPIFHAVVSRGDTFVYAPDTSKEQACQLCMTRPHATYVAELDGSIVGTYYIMPNKPDLGAHIANAGFMVHPDARGKHVGRTMGEHALKEAKRLGYHAMQFSFVVASNTHAIKLWQSLGFEIIGTVPDGYQHQKNGLTDIHLMYQKL